MNENMIRPSNEGEQQFVIGERVGLATWGDHMDWESRGVAIPFVGFGVIHTIGQRSVLVKLNGTDLLVPFTFRAKQRWVRKGDVGHDFGSVQIVFATEGAF